MPALRGFLQRFDEHLHRRGLLTRGARLLVACSGGADSVALLRLLCAVNGSRHWGFTLIVGHVDHGLRGRASTGDAAFVRRLAASLQLPYKSRALHLRKGPSGRVGEAAARAGRLAALVAMARAARCDAIVTAHHADDQAETVLMRILRGAALHGLGGIPASSLLGARFVRPLLVFTREELRDYLKEIGQPFREDASNATTDYLRNRIRHDVLPALAQLQPQVRSSLVRLAGHAQASQELLENIVAALALRCHVRGQPPRITLDRAALRAEPAIVVGELFRQIMERLDATAASSERLAAAVQIATSEHGAKSVELGGALSMNVRGPRLEFVLHPAPRKPKKA